VREALHQSEVSFRLLIEGVREYAIFMLDPNGIIVSWNAGAQRIKQYSAEEIIGKHFSVFYEQAAIDSGKPEWELTTALQEGSVEDEDWRLRRDGTRFWANVVITALYDIEGKHMGFAKVTRDLTDRRREEEAARDIARNQLHASEARFGRFAEHLPGLAWIKDLGGRYTYLNAAAARAFGRPISQIIGATDEEIFPSEIATRFKSNDLQALSTGVGIEVIELLAHPGGEVRHSIVSKFPITDETGRIHLLGGIAIDITERINAEERLRDADRRKNEFLATLAHELRNPLAPIRNGVHLLQRELEPEARGRVNRMLNEQLEHLVRLVDDLLEVSRITSGKVDLRRDLTDLRDVIRGAVDAATGLITAKSHELTLDLPDHPITVFGDQVRLVQVVANLLNNAAKYTPESGQIRVSLSRHKDEAFIKVRDNGLGIPPEMLPRVFEMFAQVDQTLGRSQGGLGIGLTLARNLVSLHGGALEGSSAGPGTGSEFTVCLPLAAPTRQPEAKQVTPETATQPVKVLVVDDSQDGADTLAMVLGLFNLNTRVAYNGPAAMAVIREWRPDVILMDIGMPGMDGFEVARQVRANPDFAPVKLIALTGWGTTEDRRRTSEAGFDDHWVKPIDPATVTALLAKFT
jgi:PAS domain S-box-containing protein